MGNVEAKTYTLAEAQRELALQGCRRSGHSFDINEVRTITDGVVRLHVRCSNCGWGGVCDMNGLDPSRLNA